MTTTIEHPNQRNSTHYVEKAAREALTALKALEVQDWDTARKAMSRCQIAATQAQIRIRKDKV